MTPKRPSPAAPCAHYCSGSRLEMALIGDGEHQRWTDGRTEGGPPGRGSDAYCPTVRTRVATLRKERRGRVGGKKRAVGREGVEPWKRMEGA